MTAVEAFFDALAARGEWLVYRETNTDAADAAHGATAPRRSTTLRTQQTERAARPWAGEALAA
jgi:hypothetical protein